MKTKTWQEYQRSELFWGRAGKILPRVAAFLVLAVAFTAIGYSIRMMQVG